MQLRPYQAELRAAIYRAWSDGSRNVCAVLPTGGGKTTVFSSIIHQHQGASIAIAHRKELVSQMSLSIAREGVAHRIVGPTDLVKLIVQEHLREFGRTFFNPNAMCAVAGVDTLVNRKNELTDFAKQCTLFVGDEGHHFLQSNKWGKAIEMFPNARGLLVTATPTRADGKGLGSHADGVIDQLVFGPTMRELIDAGYLTNYRVFCPPNDLKITDDMISDTTGDYSAPKLKKAIKESHIVGDVVAHYVRIARGKLGVVFATDVETATDISRNFNVAGIRAEVVSAETPANFRNEIIRRFRRRELDVLVNVDLFGEGFDLPAIEVISMARPTQSFSLYCQQFGRALRIMEGKTEAIIIDHVGNVIVHGLPDAAREWTLDARERGKRSTRPVDDIPLRSCTSCTRPFERFLVICPYCGERPIPAARTGPEFVDGNLLELDAATLAAMRGAIAAVDESANSVAQRMGLARMPMVAIRGAQANIEARATAQKALRESIAWWSGVHKHQGRPDEEIYKRFYLKFGVDMMTAQTLGKNDAFGLAHKINLNIGAIAK